MSQRLEVCLFVVVRRDLLYQRYDHCSEFFSRIVNVIIFGYCINYYVFIMYVDILIEILPAPIVRRLIFAVVPLRYLMSGSSRIIDLYNNFASVTRRKICADVSA